MKKLIYFLMLFSLFGCKTENKHNQVLTDRDWRNIVHYSFVIAHVQKPYVFKEFDNNELKGIISFTYVNSKFLGYEINDSILNYVKTRENKPITNRLDTMYNIKFITDTIGFHEDYLIYSEPFYVNDKIICVAMSKSNKKRLDNSTSHWVFFFRKKKNKSFILLGYYDVKKDMFYKAINLSPNSIKGARYRLRSKLGLNSDEDLAHFVGSID